MRRKSIIATRIIEPQDTFMRIYVSRQRDDPLPLIVRKESSIEQLVRQIEATIWFENFPMGQYVPCEQNNAMFVKIFEIYDSSNIALPFLSKVKDCLNFDDIVSLSDTSTGNDYPKKEAGVSSLDKFTVKGGSLFDLVDTVNETSTAEYTVSSVDDRLLSILYNSKSLAFFNEFCLREFAIENVLFWIEAECFKSLSTAEERKTMAKRLISTYIEHNSPLSLNIEESYRNAVAEANLDNLDSTFFDEFQDFVFVLLKVHAYPRFELSDLFERFLTFKRKDPYCYIQGKTNWDFDLTCKKVPPEAIENLSCINCRENLLPSLYCPEEVHNDNLELAAYRSKVLFSILAFYFPDNESIVDNYFNVERRKDWKKKQLQKKQKRLKKFFGRVMSDEQMLLQGVVKNDYIEVGDQNDIFFKDDLDDFPDLGSGMEKRRRASKLAAFFGDNLPNKQMKKQNLMIDVNITNSSSVSSYVIPFVEEEDDRFVGAINQLAPEEKQILTKRAKKLITLLGSGAEPIAINNKVGERAEEELNNPLVESKIDIGQSNRTSEIDAEDEYGEAKKISQKQRLDKLSHFLGHRILHDDLNHNVPTIARPLTNREKQLYRKRVDKLEKLFGATVSTKDIISYENNIDSSSEEDIQVENATTLDITQNDFKRKQQLAKIRKIQKILGIEGPQGDIINDRYLNDLERSIEGMTGNELTRKLLKEELQWIRDAKAQ